MTYEDVALQENFEDDEVTYEKQRERNRDKIITRALKKAQNIDANLSDLKALTTKGMQSFCHSLSRMEDQSQKMAFMHFDPSVCNTLAKTAPEIIQRLEQIEEATDPIQKNLPMHQACGFNSEDCPSDSSGNNSLNDEVNQIEDLKTRMSIVITHGEEDDDDDLSDFDGKEEVTYNQRPEASRSDDEVVNYKGEAGELSSSQDEDEHNDYTVDSHLHLGQSVELTPFKVPKEMSIIQKKADERSQLDEIEELVNDVYQSADTLDLPPSRVSGTTKRQLPSETADFVHTSTTQLNKKLQQKKIKKKGAPFQS